MIIFVLGMLAGAIIAHTRGLRHALLLIAVIGVAHLMDTLWGRQVGAWLAEVTRAVLGW